MEVQPAQYYVIDDRELPYWKINSAVLADIASGAAIMNNGTIDLTDPVSGLNFLKSVTRQSLPMAVDIQTITLNIFQKIAQMIWVTNRNSSFSTGTVLCEIEVPTSVGLQIRIIDATNNVVLATSPVYTTSGIKTFTFNNPSSDCRIEVQAKHNSIVTLLVNPTVDCLILEWDT